MVTQDTLGALIPILTQKREKKNYQEILMEYLNYLGKSENKLNSISKEMKSNFFQNINEEELNTHDDLKFLILMREEIFKYKIKKYYFNKYKNKALYHRDLIDEDNPFINNNILDYQQFKKIKSNVINKDSINFNNYLNNNMNDKNKKIDINDLFKSSSKKSIHTNENSSRNENMNYNDLLYRSSKKSINLQDSINVLDIQKNINEALNNTNDLFNKIRLHNSGYINYNNQFQNSNDINNIDGNNNENKFIKAKSNLLPNYKNNLININENKNNNNKINYINKIDNTNKNYQININNNIGKKDSINEDLYDDKDSMNNNLIENNEEIKHFYNITNLEKYKNIFNNLKNRENINKFNDQNKKSNDIIGKTNNIEENLDKYNNRESYRNYNKESMDNYNNIDKIDNNIYNIPNKDNDVYNNIKNSNLEDYQNNIITNDNIKKSIKNEENEYKNKNYLDNYPNNFYNNIIIKNNNNNFEIDTSNNNNEKIIYKNIKIINQDNIDNYQPISNNNNTNKKDSIHKYNSYKTNIKNNRKTNNNINKSNTENKSNVFSIRSRKKNLNSNNEKKNNTKLNNYNSNKPKKTLNSNNKNKLGKNNNKSFNKLDNNKKNSISIKNKINKNKSSNKIEKKKNSINPKPNQNNENVIKQQQKQFDLKNLFRLPIKEKNIDEDDKQKYNNSKYLSRKFRNYLNTEENINKSKKKYIQKSPIKNNINTNLYNNSLFGEKDKDIIVSLNTDSSLIKQINSNNNPKNMNINKIQIVKNNNLINNRDLSADRIRDIDKSIESISNNNYNTNDLLNNGFFAGKSIKKNNNDNKSNYSQKTDNNRYDLLNQKIEIMLQKNNEFKELLKMKNINIDNKNKNNLNNNYDYIKKCKGIAADIYGLNNNENNLNINNYYMKTNYNDQEYDSIFHPKNNNKINYLNTIENTKSNTSINNLLENLDNKKDTKNMIDYGSYYDYDDLINNISDNQKTKARKTINKSISIKSKKDYLTPNNNIDENQNSYVLAPMAKIPVTNISFRARLKYYSNKKEKELKKMKQKLIEEEKQIYTFHPKTGENKLNVIKYNNYKNNLNLTQDFENNNKRKVDLNRIENLYLDYKDKINKREELAREYYKEAGISFSPILKDNNKEMIRYKKKVAQMPYLDRIEFYNRNYEFNRNKNQYLAEEK